MQEIEKQQPIFIRDPNLDGVDEQDLRMVSICWRKDLDTALIESYLASLGRPATLDDLEPLTRCWNSDWTIEEVNLNRVVVTIQMLDMLWLGTSTSEAEDDDFTWSDAHTMHFSEFDWSSSTDRDSDLWTKPNLTD